MKIATHFDLEVFKMAFETSMKIYEISKSFPNEEMYSMTDQVRRSSRSVCANISEAFRKRRYAKSFILKLSDSEAEAAETQTWLYYALKCNYISKELFDELLMQYNRIIGMLVTMIKHSQSWTLPT
ncbi:MAG: four helix bundle protein [Bacteroidota bacterium]|nr:four helix bundle protein [Bacteroidota bacterium]MDP4197442.1 four helix bundle protein [Bacteroidota bacterium]